MRGAVAAVALLATASSARAQSQPPESQPPPPSQSPEPSSPSQPSQSQPPPPSEPPSPSQPPQSQPPPPSQAQPPAQPPLLPPQPPTPTQAPWYRLTLNDGRVVDVQIVGGDPMNLHVQMHGAVYSLPRAHVVTSVALQPAVLHMPPPAPEAAGTRGNKRLGGIVNFCLWYGVTAMIATVRAGDEPDARLVPVLGPLLWAVPNDEDGFLQDGWDWLAVLDTTMQGISAYWILTGGKDGAPSKVTLTPVTRRHFHGIALGGSF